MTDDRIMTLHPQGKAGVNLLQSKYNRVKETLVSILEEPGEISFKQLNDTAIERLEGQFDGKIPWYVVTVKLDLEARGTIERVPKSGPQRIRLKN